MGGIAVISNPRSGRNRRNPHLVRKLAYVLGEAGELAQPPDLDHLEETVRGLKARDIDVVCVSGGDGTLHKTLSALVRVYAEGAEGDALRQVRLPRVALLKGGTMNTVARNVGVRVSAAHMLGRVVSAYHSGEPMRVVERNMMVVDGTHAGFLFGTGVLGRFMQAYYAGGDEGPWKAVKVVARLIGSGIVGGAFTQHLFARDACVVRLDGAQFEPSEYSGVAAGTLADLGLGFRPFFRSLDHPDHAHVLGLACDAISLVKAAVRIRLARPIDRPDVVDRVGQRLTISSGGPIPCMIDGDFFEGGQTVVVEVGPRVPFIVM